MLKTNNHDSLPLTEAIIHYITSRIEALLDYYSQKISKPEKSVEWILSHDHKVKETGENVKIIAESQLKLQSGYNIELRNIDTFVTCLTETKSYKNPYNCIQFADSIITFDFGLVGLFSRVPYESANYTP